MNVTFLYDKIRFPWLITFTLLMACVERIDFDVPPAQYRIVVEGLITDAPGPYTVSLSKALNVNIDSVVREPETKAKLTLYDDQGNTESFIEVSDGIYATNGNLQGQIGHAYHIGIETFDGRQFESEPDLLHAVGEISEIRIEFDKRTVVETYGEIPADVFNIFVDADAGSESDNFVRWKFTGTYKVITDPAHHYTWIPPYTPYLNPYPCSGYVISPALGGGALLQVGECECCTCWVNHFEPAPNLSDMQLISGTQFKNVKVGEVPINNITFYEKYLVEVEQMSMSRNTFEFFKLLRAQKEGSSSLFQPPSGEIRGNIKALNSNDPVIGLFWASSVKKKSKFIQRDDVPYPITAIEYITDPCNVYFKNASTTKPAGWE